MHQTEGFREEVSGMGKKRKRKKAASGGKRSLYLSQKDIKTYRKIADKAYQGKISPVSKE